MLSMALLLLTQVAYADFRKALDAYIARDGETILKEVKNAVEKKNDHGLILFLMATSFDSATSDYDSKHSQTTLRTTLTETEWHEMELLLEKAVYNSTVEAQHSLLNSAFGKSFVIRTLRASSAKPKKNYSLKEINDGYGLIREKINNNGLIIGNSDIVKRAEANDLSAQLLLGLTYSNYLGSYGISCNDIPDYFTCKSLDEVKGDYWLKRAVKTYEKNGFERKDLDYPELPVAICDFLQSKPKASDDDIKQAYLWCQLGLNFGSMHATSILKKIYSSGKLKLEGVNQNRLGVPASDIKEWPELLLQARAELEREQLPLFSYIFSEIGTHEIAVYSDGRVFLNPKTTLQSDDWLMTVKPEKLNKFLEELYQIGFKKWPLFSGGSACDIGCGFTQSSFMLRTKNTPRRVTFFSDRMVLSTAKSSPLLIREAKLKLLVDTYFPTKQVRIELGNSKKIKQKLLAREAEWIELAQTAE